MSVTGLFTRAREATPSPRPGGLFDERVPAAQAVSRTLARVGRVVLWLVLGWIALAGIVGYVTIVRGGHDTAVRANATASAFPGDDTKAFAASFATTLMTYTPADAEQRERTLQAMSSRELDGGRMLELDGQRAQRVDGAWPAGVTRIDGQHAFVTVAVVIRASGLAPVTRYLTVPVARDADGGLAVYGLPAPAAPPALSAIGDVRTAAVDTTEASGIEALLEQFLSEQYLSGGQIASQYLVPGARIVALGQRYDHVSLTSIELASRAGMARTVLATVQATDAATGAEQTMRLRITVEYRDQHWLIKSIG